MLAERRDDLLTDTVRDALAASPEQDDSRRRPTGPTRCWRWPRSTPAAPALDALTHPDAVPRLLATIAESPDSDRPGRHRVPGPLHRRDGRGGATAEFYLAVAAAIVGDLDEAPRSRLADARRLDSRPGHRLDQPARARSAAPPRRRSAWSTVPDHSLTAVEETRMTAPTDLVVVAARHPRQHAAAGADDLVWAPSAGSVLRAIRRSAAASPTCDCPTASATTIPATVSSRSA